MQKKSQYTFRNFVAGSRNRFIKSAAKEIAKKNGTEIKSFYIYGNHGMGKTHLLQAIKSEVLRSNQKINVCYICAEEFVNQLVDSIQNGRLIQFRKKSQKNYDLVLVDDLHFISGKERTMAEFLSIFNEQSFINRRLVVASRYSPKNDQRLDRALASRFESGLIVEVQRPSLKGRLKIIRKEAIRLKLSIEQKTALKLARKFKTDVRELQGALLALKMRSVIHNGY